MCLFCVLLAPFVVPVLYLAVHSACMMVNEKTRASERESSRILIFVLYIGDEV